MRLLYFSRDYTPHDYRFLKALSQTEHEVLYLRLEKRGEPSEKRSLPEGIQPVRWRGGNAPVCVWDGPGLVRELKLVIQEHQPDLIHAGPVQRSAFLVALTGFHPLVSMSWGYDLLIDARRNWAWTWATRFTLKRSDAFVGDCQTIREQAVMYGMAPERIVTFPWGIDLEHFSPEQGPNPVRERLGWAKEDTFVLLSSRTWAPLYGIPEMVEGVIQAARQRPELRLLMLGTGPLDAYVRERFREAGLQDRVHFPGLIPWGKLPLYYRAADLYLSASHSDGSSISLLEALACGTPVLVSDIPGNQEWVQPGRQGWLFPVGKAQALAETLLFAYDERHSFPAMQAQARLTAEKRANWTENFPELFEAYQIAFAQVERI